MRLIIILLLACPCFATTRFVKPGGTGTGTTDWTNAAGCLNSVTMNRGDLIYIAGGNYVGACATSMQIQTANSGTTTIEIRKATDGDHGAANGWTNGGTMGNSQAVIPPFRINGVDWIIINGVSRTTPTSGHGIKCLNNNGSGGTLTCGSSGCTYCISVGNQGSNLPSNHITIQYVETQGTGFNSPGSCPPVTDGGIEFTSGFSGGNATGNFLKFSYMHDTGGDSVDMLHQDQITFDHIYTARNYSNSSGAQCHGDMIAVNYVTNWTMSNSVQEDAEGTCWLCDTNTSVTNGPFFFYGDVIWRPSSPTRNNTTNGIWDWVSIASFPGTSYFVNNTFINAAPGATGNTTCDPGFDGGINVSGTLVWENNLFDHCPHTETGSNPGITGTWVWDHNTSVSSGTTDVSSGAQNVASGEFVTGWPSGNFLLTTDTASGVNTNAVLPGNSVDPNGFPRGSTDNGTWSRGAYQFGSTGTCSNLPAFSANPSPVNFPSTIVGQASNPITIAITNIGCGANLTTGLLSVGANFSISNGCNSQTLVPSPGTGSSCNFTATCVPTTTGLLNGTITVPDNAGNPDSISLSCTGVPSPTTPVAPAVWMMTYR